MKKRCIVTFASHGIGNYIHGLARLSESLRNNFDGDLLAFTSEESIGAPKHSELPYAFKLHAIGKAVEAGYTSILWLDCSCFAVAPLAPLFEHIESKGYIIQDAGHYVGTWTNDNTLNAFKMSRDEAMNIKCYGNAGFLGLDMNNSTANSFMAMWDNRMYLFAGRWNNDEKTESQDDRCKGHRHDMSVGSIIAHKLGMELQSGDQWLQYAGPYDKIANDSILIKAQGI